jgi:choline dehydrogenase-like flavoprotein
VRIKISGRLGGADMSRKDQEREGRVPLHTLKADVDYGTSEAATTLGYHPYRAPTGVNRVEYDGRPACNNCGFCGYFGCPIDAKRRPGGTASQRARTGRCEIRPESVVTEVVLDRGGRVRAACVGSTQTGARSRCRLRTSSSPAVRSRHWLLLQAPASATPDVVGRYLMYHFQTLVLGVFPFRLHAIAAARSRT